MALGFSGVAAIAHAGPEIMVKEPSGGLSATTVQAVWTNAVNGPCSMTSYEQATVPAGLTAVQAVGCDDFLYVNGFTSTPSEPLTRGQATVPAALTNPATANVVAIVAWDTYSAAVRLNPCGWVPGGCIPRSSGWSKRSETSQTPPGVGTTVNNCPKSFCFGLWKTRLIPQIRPTALGKSTRPKDFLNPLPGKFVRPAEFIAHHDTLL